MPGYWKVMLLSFVFMWILSSAASEHTEQALYHSPTGKFYCKLEPKKMEQDGQIDDGTLVYLCPKSNIEKEFLIFNAIRGVDIKWSPDDYWLAIIDNNDGHKTNIHILHIIESRNNKNILKTEIVYSDPTTGNYSPKDIRGNTLEDVFWDLVAWDIPQGKIVIKCTFASEDRSYNKTLKYEVPIALPSPAHQAVENDGKTIKLMRN